MNLSERRRLFLLGLLLTATLAAAAVSGIEKEEGGVVEPRARKSESVDGVGEPSSKKTARLDPSQIKREAVEPVEVDIFMSKSWQPPPPPPAPQATAPVMPVAPPLPFAYAGRLGDPSSGKVIVYLSRADTVYTVSVGDVIDEQYRLETIAENLLTFIYLPLKMQQTLAVPSK
ncbi:MAG TPA: hypothetical protein VE715_04485 [Blastocatellia bacterium]|nr:hypothetical protein [Blastocatellia bacterium]